MARRRANRLAWAERVLGKKIPEIANILGVPVERVEDLLKEADPRFWENIKVNEVKYSFGKDRRLSGYAKLIEKKGIPLDLHESNIDYKIYDHDLTSKEKEVKEKEKYLRIMDHFSSYAFSAMAAREGRDRDQAYKEYMLRDALEDKGKMKQHVYSIISYHPSAPFSDRALFFVHKDLGPVGIVTSGHVSKGNGEKAVVVDRLLAHPIVSDPDFESAVGAGRFVEVVNNEDVKRTAKDAVITKERNKLQVGTVMLLKMMLDHPEFEISANHRTWGVIKKIEEKLGKNFFRIVEKRPGTDFVDIVFSRSGPKKRTRGK